MMRPRLSPAGASLLRGLMARAGIDRDRVRISSFRSVDWQSLTFVGERHEIALRIPGPDAAALLDRLTGGLSDGEWTIPRQIVADIALFGAPTEHRDGSISLTIEALTIAE